jgi:hypothetical protein
MRRHSRLQAAIYRLWNNCAGTNENPQAYGIIVPALMKTLRPEGLSYRIF